MDENKERKLTVIENVKVDEKVEAEPKQVLQTNPIAKKLLEFHHQKLVKFSVKDLFK